MSLCGSQTTNVCLWLQFEGRCGTERTFCGWFYLMCLCICSIQRLKQKLSVGCSLRLLTDLLALMIANVCRRKDLRSQVRNNMRCRKKKRLMRQTDMSNLWVSLESRRRIRLKEGDGQLNMFNKNRRYQAERWEGREKEKDEIWWQWQCGGRKEENIHAR